MTEYSLHLCELALEVDDPDWKSWTFTIFLIDILHFQKGQGADMEKTDFPARCFSWWGLLGLRQLAVCRISSGWIAGAELCRGLSGSSVVQMFVLFPVESACGGRSSCAWSQALYSITRQGTQRPALPLALVGGEEDAGIKW